MVLDLRGSTPDQVRAYLVSLGGAPRPDGTVAGPDWTATLEAGEHRAFGAVWPRVVVTFSGDPQSVARVVSGLRLRAMRGGG